MKLKVLIQRLKEIAKKNPKAEVLMPVIRDGRIAWGSVTVVADAVIDPGTVWLENPSDSCDQAFDIGTGGEQKTAVILS